MSQTYDFPLKLGTVCARAAMQMYNTVPLGQYSEHAS